MVIESIKPLDAFIASLEEIKADSCERILQNMRKIKRKEKQIVNFKTNSELYSNENDLKTTKEYKRLQGQQYTIVSKVAYLIGVSEMWFGDDTRNFDKAEYDKLRTNKNARIIRNLCILRTSIEQHFTAILVDVKKGRRLINAVTDYIPQKNIVTELLNDGVKVSQKAKATPFDAIIEINGLIANRINNCSTIFPNWLNWQYVRNIFIMPDGKNVAMVKKEGNTYKTYIGYYPYNNYVNIPVPHECKNILGNDQRFVNFLYEINNDSFADRNKVVDVDEEVKGNIYDFIDDAEKLDMIVDCENSDVYNIISMLKNLDEENLSKVNKIILIDDPHTNAGWQELEYCTDIEIEHIIVERLLENKSLVDGSVIGKVYREHYEENVSSIVLLSSDSDYWTLLRDLRDRVDFLLMIEHQKCSSNYKRLLIDEDILFCYLDDFNSGEEAERLKTEMIYRGIETELKKISFNLKDAFDETLESLRITMDEAIKSQLYNRQIKPLQIAVDDEGVVSISLKRKN